MTRALALAIAASLFFAGVAQAATYSGTASWGQIFTITFTTSTPGTVTAEVTWLPKANGRYAFDLRHYADPNDLSSYDHACWVNENANGTTSYSVVNPATGTRGDWLCTIPDGPVGTYMAFFSPTSGGKVPVTIVTSP